MKKSIILSAILFVSSYAQAQIAQTTVVEHFTNSNCGVCAANNPNIYTTLNTYPNVLHITFHPSSPYASCVFSQQNPSENDARTNYYSIYGSTPRLIVNGSLVSTASLNTSLSATSSLNTSYQISLTQQFITTDSVFVKVKIKKIAADTFTNAILFVGAFQDTIFQTTGNGESVHHDVFRKSLSAITGDNITLPNTVNDSIEVMYQYHIASTWAANRMNSLAILQSSNKKVINAAQSTNVTLAPSALKDITVSSNAIFPNPCTNILNINDAKNYTSVRLINQLGKVVFSENLIGTKSIDLSNIVKGFYVVELIDNNNHRKVSKLIKE